MTVADYFSSCKKEEEEQTTINPTEYESEVTIRDTFQSAFLSIPEMPYGDTLTSLVKSEVEFPAYLGMYKIDINNSTINFELIPEAANNPSIAALFRVIEAGTYDRYYITFNKPQNLKNVSTNNTSVKASIISNTEIKIEIGEGYNFTPGNAVFSVKID
jgi:hypothetical protein